MLSLDALARGGERGLVGDVLARHWDGCVPVRPVAIAAALGWEVWRADDLAEDLGARIDPQMRRIAASSSHELERFRFAVAHALGRVLAQASIRSSNVQLADFRLGALGAARIANEFAGRLLVPTVALEFVLRERLTVDALATRFRVSGALMKHRLEQSIF